MNQPILPLWLDRKIEERETSLESAIANTEGDKVRHYLHSLRYGEVDFRQEPVINIQTSEVLYWEHLLRVKDTQGNELLTGNVLKTLNSWDVLPLVGQYLIELALIQAQKFECNVGLNVPPQLFMSSSFRKTLGQRLKEAKEDGVKPEQVFLEVLETPYMNISDDMEPMFKWFDKMIEKGYRLGLDDFGAPNGQHTFKHLQKLPVSFLKLDWAVVETMVNGTFDKSAYKDVFEYCVSNNIPIIAEHVETVNDAKKLGTKYPITHVQSFKLTPKNF